MQSKFVSFLAAWIVALSFSFAQQKERFIPEKVWMVPENESYTDSTSEFSFSRMLESDNLVIFWSKEYGNDPSINEDSTKTIDLENAILECERFYDYYVNELAFVEKGNSVTDKYKVLMYIFGGDDGTAYGGGEGDIGILWTPPARMHRPPYGALAHELGHSFQYLVNANGNWGFTSAPEGSHGHSIFEMTSQYMLWQVYPEWMTFENYHLQAFMDKTHFAFLHETNMYHSPYVLEYWSHLHGKKFIGKLWQQAQEGEDVVLAYKRLTHLDQSQFNDEIFSAYQRFMTWDIPRIETVAAPYANQHHTLLISEPNGWYRIAPEKCPQNYGYNGIELEIPDSKKITLKFEGIESMEGYRSIKTELAGWRYGFVAVNENGERTYSDSYQKNKAIVKFKVPKNTKHLWLVVSGAPTTHWEHLLDGKDENDEQWPYRFSIKGTKPVSKIISE